MFEMLLTDDHMLVTRSREAAERHVGLAPGESLQVQLAIVSSRTFSGQRIEA
jgi:hypothetical protein